MTFRPPRDDKSLTEVIDLEIMKEKLVVVTTSPLVCYIFSKVCLHQHWTAVANDRRQLHLNVDDRTPNCIEAAGSRVEIVRSSLYRFLL